MSVVTVNTDVEICNLALDRVKEAPIAALSDNRAAARWMNRNYTPVRNKIFNVQKWKFATERAELAEDATTPAFEWGHRHKKPNDCFRVLPLRVDGRLNGRMIPHEVEGDYILSNVSGPLKIRYIKLIDNEAAWPAHFVEAVVTRLASDVAHFLSGKQAMFESLEQKHKEALQLAATIDASEGTHPEQVANAYTDTRYYHRDLGDSLW
jgi:hypothetical protein